MLLQSADTVVEDYILAYNENGLRKSVEMTGSLPQTNALVSASFDDANEMLTHDDLDLTYDANGNLIYMFDNTTQEGTTYTWDARNRLVGISSSSVTATFSYDAVNRRTERVVNGITTQYAYDGLNVIKETKNPGQSTDYVYSLNIDEPLYLERADGTVRYYMADALGSIVALADGDTGNVTTTYSYDAFGNVTINGSDENPFQYTGRENDETGLYYYRARYYSSTLRRFISEDPIGMAAGLNYYAYVNNDPVNFVDPLGLYGTNDCSYYSKRCDEIGGDYYCETAPEYCDNKFKKFPDPDPSRDDDYEGWVRCTRQCLQDCDAENATGMCKEDVDDFWDQVHFNCHVKCYTECGEGKITGNNPY